MPFFRIDLTFQHIKQAMVEAPDLKGAYREAKKLRDMFSYSVVREVVIHAPAEKRNEQLIKNYIKGLTTRYSVIQLDPAYKRILKPDKDSLKASLWSQQQQKIRIAKQQRLAEKKLQRLKAKKKRRKR